MKVFLSVVSLLFSFQIYAQESKLATIKSDLDTDRTEFYLSTKADGSIDSIRFVTTTASGQVTRDDIHPIEQVIDTGIVLVERSNREVLRVDAENFSIENGGTVKLNYLFSGINNSRRIIRLNLTRQEEGFGLSTLDGQKVNQLFVVANRSGVFGIIGIREIRTSFLM